MADPLPPKWANLLRSLTIIICLPLLSTTTHGWKDDLRVLPESSEADPSEDMLSRYLAKQLDEALERRRSSYEEIQTPEQVAAYQERLKQKFIEHLGGFPERTPLNAKVVGTIVGDGYRIEKLLYESQPKHFVTAILFLPDAKPPHPGVVVPCGHSASGKAAQQRICILLAKNGIAALSYDPIGQGERNQVLDNKGLKRLKATSEHNLVGVGSVPLGRNTATFRIWDGMRSIDYLAGRDDIDPSKIGVTGCSGGGTLTSYLMALDDRVACAAPSCYITSFRRLLDTIGPQDAEQNIHGQLGFGMDHADYLMMRAPKPTLVLASTQDFFDIEGTWDSFRQAKRLYTRLDHPERVGIVETNAKHGYPKLQREAMVHWMRRHLMGIDTPVRETDFATHPVEELQCTPRGQTLLLESARSVIDLNVEHDKQLEQQRNKLWNSDDLSAALDKVREIAGIQNLDDPEVKVGESIQRKGYRIVKVEFRRKSGISIPGLRFFPEKGGDQAVLYLNGEGKHVDASEGGPIEKLVLKGNDVLALDLRGMGESKTTGRDIMVSYLLGRSLVGMRAEDAIVAARKMPRWGGVKFSQDVHLIASGSAIAPAIHAAALENDLFASLKIEGEIPSWSEIVADPEKGRMSETVHGALNFYDLPDLVAAFNKMQEQK